ncbi:heme exporter protein CcmD [Microbulbifer flavimaris]|uniref:Heme exporter protein D n=1 Tax=Microbulbifer flavimaris TaxID=1781068 RepID=A0ABX4HVK6_9GAMM|nr:MULTISPECIES: heme exporter protein CcmD [Microbulbifer]KUJ79215.1 heme exporter protein CcmD [Microbulbifer sp. ZGT114]PCO04139.1 heme exporter protein CcmD [Microbulbifer flavimaris]
MQFQFDSLAAFLHMDGHGTFVWAAYGVTFLTLTALALQPRLQRRRLKRELERQQRIEARRRSVETRRTREAEPA